MEGVKHAKITGEITDAETLKRIKREFVLVSQSVDDPAMQFRAQAKNGRYRIDRVPAGVLYKVEIDGVVGLPCAVEPREGHNRQDFLYVTGTDLTRENAVVSGHVVAFQGNPTVELSGKQTFRWEDQATGTVAWPTDDTTDQRTHKTYQVTVVPDRTYQVFVNHCLPKEGTHNPPPSSSTQTFHRNFGTANVSVPANYTNDNRMRLNNMSTQLVTPRVVVIPPQGAKLVSAPAASPGPTAFKLEIKQVDDGSFAQAQNSPVSVT